ncbi:MAG: hypothetical protein CMM44_03735 [Rhodospirillaceae bacterium]|nr:hypothetical protein [Rhodospirillaceae bacterium]
MFIQTEGLSLENQLRFDPGREVLPGKPIKLENPSEAKKYPLAERLLLLSHVRAVTLENRSLVVERSDEIEWVQLKPAILGAIMDHFVAGLPVYHDEELSTDHELGEDDQVFLLDQSDPIVGELTELIATRVKPAATQSGGDVILMGYSDGVVYLKFEGQSFQLASGIENMLRHYIPEVKNVADYRDAFPKPGLDTPEARAIKSVLETRINPAVSGHGGHISLIDVDGNSAYIRMEGGCQGCGMANATLKEGVEVEIKKAVPTIERVLDVTEHADGTNPYYQQG